MYKFGLLTLLVSALCLTGSLASTEHTLVNDKQIFGMLPGMDGDLQAALHNKNRAIRLIFVRHGETCANVEKIVDGRTLDSDLTEKGIQQAQAAAEKLQGIKFEKIYSSPSTRAMRTASYVSKYDHQKPILVDSRLYERFFGPYEGTPDETWNGLKHQQEEEIAALVTFEERFAYKLHPDMESNEEIYQRLSDFITEITKSEVFGNYLIVTHGGVLKAFFMAEAAKHGYILNFYDFSSENCGMMVVDYLPSGHFNITTSQIFKYLK